MEKTDELTSAALVTILSAKFRLPASRSAHQQVNFQERFTNPGMGGHVKGGAHCGTS